MPIQFLDTLNKKHFGHLCETFVSVESQRVPGQLIQQICALSLLQFCQPAAPHVSGLRDTFLLKYEIACTCQACQNIPRNTSLKTK